MPCHAAAAAEDATIRPARHYADAAAFHAMLPLFRHCY